MRQPVSSKALPQNLKYATVAIEDRTTSTMGARSDRHRRRRLEGPAGRRQAGPGRVDDHRAARPEPQHPQPRKDAEAKAGRSGPAYEEEEADPKQWILTAYLNTAAYGTVQGETAVGAEAAAQTYYGKPARELGLTEAALIAGLPQAPSEYNPSSTRAPRSNAATRCSKRCGTRPTSRRANTMGRSMKA